MTKDVAMVVYVDVDDTLVRSMGSKRMPIPRAIERVKQLRDSGATLYLWSTAGAQYARETAVELKIAEYFVDFLPKPNLILDDQPVSEWRGCKYEYPG